MICGFVKIAAAAVVCLVTALPVQAEYAFYGAESLEGLARNSWPLNTHSYTQVGMVCNVNGPDGFLTIRTGPGSGYASARKLNRLAIVEVVPTQRQGRWVPVVHAYRTVTKDGYSQNVKQLPVQGWAHDGYLCGFVH